MIRTSSLLRQLRLLGVSVLFLMALGGCGQSLLSPPLNPGGEPPRGPEVLVIQSDGTVSYRQPDSTSGTGSPALVATKQIDGSQGGWIQCGRFFVAFPQGAFDSLATVTMSMRDSTVMVVQLEIDPPSRNQFKSPVVLAVNTTGTNVSSDTLSMYWYNPDARDWTGLSCEKTMSGATYCVDQVDGNSTESPNQTTASQGVWTGLTHFSTYSAGKAGW